MQLHIAKAISISAIAALALTGCAVEYLNPDGQCADITTDQFPALYYDNYEVAGSSDVYFEVETDGSFDAMYAYAGNPDISNSINLLSQTDDAFIDFLSGLDSDTVALDRWNTSFDVSDASPHRVSLGADQLAGALVMFGLSVPVGVVATCDDTAYQAAMPTTAPSNGIEGLVEKDLVDSDAKLFYPGYDPDAFEVALPGDNELQIDVAADDVVYMNAIVVPWIGQFGDIREASFEERWYAALVGIYSALNANLLGNVSVGADGDLSSSESFVVDSEYVNYEFFSEWATMDPNYSGFEDDELLGALVITLAAHEVSPSALQVQFSYEVAEFGANGSFGAVGGADGTPYNGPQYNDELLKGKPGEQVTLLGTNMKVDTVTIGGQPAKIIANSATSLTLEIPETLEGGRYDVHYTFDGGDVTRQLGATVIDHSVWTKRLSDSQAKLYAKNIAGAGKVQLMLNGKEVAWVNAIDANDPKLRKANGDHYLVRTVNLKPGKNVLEIWVDGVRERRTVYTR